VLRAQDLNEAGRGRATLALGILALRWATLAWMAVLAVLSVDDLDRPAFVVVAFAAALAWTVWLTVARPRWTAVPLAIDLGLAVVLAILPGFAGQRGGLGAADLPSFENPYPVAAVLTWGVALGVRGGLLAGAAVGLALVAGRLANGMPLRELGGTAQAMSIAGGTVNFLLAGGGIGLVCSLLERSWARLARAQEESAVARERAARLAEREALARRIHDSVLQSLAMVHKRGRELAGAGPVPPEEVARLAELAGGQERALRALVLRAADDEAAAGSASLRSALEELAVAFPATRPGSPPVTVGAVGPLWLPAGAVAELRDAVRQALENAAGHAGASRVSVFAEEEGDEVVVTVRDDGAGFVYDEAALRAAGKIGLLSSIKGRAEQLGGRARVETAPGMGTEIELRVPVAGAAGRAGVGGER
jgi:signal transduction histidine kinase